MTAGSDLSGTTMSFQAEIEEDVFWKKLSKKMRLKTPAMRIEMQDNVPIKPLSISTSCLVPVAW